MLMKSLAAFAIGGLTCLIAQILIDKTKITPAKILVFYVVFGVFFGAVGLYKPLFEICGCGISLPLIGFGSAIADGVRSAVDEMGIMGILKGPFTAMSQGATLALTLGFLASVFFKGKSKKM